jgi:diguanylate cyclase
MPISTTNGRADPIRAHCWVARNAVGILSARFTRATVGVGALVALYVIWIGFSLGGYRIAGGFDDISEFVASGVAAICCLLAARRSDQVRLRATWRLLAGSAAAWTVGEIVWTIYDARSVGQPSVPIPSYADIGFVVSLLFALVALLGYPAAPRGRISRLRLLLDGVITAGSLLYIAWETLLSSVFHQSNASTATRVLLLTYPVGDLVIVGVAASMFSARLGRRAISLGLLIAGFLCLAVSDSAIAYLNPARSYGTVSHLSDVGWVAGFLLVALSTIAPNEVTSNAQPFLVSRWQQFFPYVPFTSGLVVTVVESLRNSPIRGVGEVVGLTVLGAVAARQILSLEENRYLARHLEATVAGMRRNEAVLRYQGEHDLLTGQANRFFLAEVGRAALGRTNRRGLVAVILCDLDGFKEVNDALGHDGGDEILDEVGRRLSTGAPETATIARVGADEFAILLDGADRLEDVEMLARALGEVLQTPFPAHGSAVELSASLGVATTGRGQMGFDVLMRNADIALDEAKRTGRGVVRMFDRQLGEAFRERATLRAELLRATERGEFFLEYQPIIDAVHGAPVGVEALLRWNHPRRGVLQPDAFIAVAEATGAIVEIGAWVLRESLVQVAKWRSVVGARADGLWVAVNVSARQFVRGDLVGDVRRAIRESGLLASALRLELTESILIERPERAITILEEIRSLGVALEIDDFGTGYSSLGYLRQMPVDALKIDRTFVEGLGVDAQNTALVETMVTLAHALDLEVIAEGVEGPSQLTQLRELNCDQVQGYYCSRPLLPTAFADWMMLREPLEVL